MCVLLQSLKIKNNITENRVSLTSLSKNTIGK